MTYRVNLARHAQEDRERAFDWYSANYSQEYALRWFSGISEAIASLSINPQRCPKAIEDDRFPFDLYELAYGTRKNQASYSIHYSKWCRVHRSDPAFRSA